MTKPTVRWRAMSNAKPRYADMHRGCVYTIWKVRPVDPSQVKNSFRLDADPIVIHDPKQAQGHEYDTNIDKRIMSILGFPPFNF